MNLVDALSAALEYIFFANIDTFLLIRLNFLSNKINNTNLNEVSSSNYTLSYCFDRIEP